MSETKAQLEKKLEFILKENEELRAENRELRMFVNYVRGLKTDEDFLNLKLVLEQADLRFKQKENEE